jgi:hypothetical protein
VTPTATRASLAPPRETAEGWRGLEAFLAYLGTRGSLFEPPRPAQAGRRPSGLTFKKVAFVSSLLPFVSPFYDLKESGSAHPGILTAPAPTNVNVGSPKHVSASLLRAPSPCSRAHGVGPAAGG